PAHRLPLSVRSPVGGMKDTDARGKAGGYDREYGFGEAAYVADKPFGRLRIDCDQEIGHGGPSLPRRKRRAANTLGTSAASSTSDRVAGSPLGQARRKSTGLPTAMEAAGIEPAQDFDRVRCLERASVRRCSRLSSSGHSRHP